MIFKGGVNELMRIFWELAGVRPFACRLCDKTYGRRDYLQRHLKSHNASYAVNLSSGGHGGRGHGGQGGY